MKALSIMQPWCEAILELGKRLENRHWQGCAYRGPLVILASKKVGTILDFDAAVEGILFEDVLGDEKVRSVEETLKKLRAEERKFKRGPDKGESYYAPSADMQLGGIVGVCQIVGVVETSAGVTKLERRVPNQHRWYTGGFALVLDDVQRVPFTPWKGEQGFFDVPNAVVNQLIARAA